MKEDIGKLIELQAIDSEIVRLKEKEKRLPEEREKIDAEMAAFTEETGTIEAQVNELLRQHREKERECETNQEHVSKIKGRLLAIKTNNEYHAALKEIDYTEKKNEEIEDGILSLLEEIDAARTAFDEQNAKTAVYRAEYERKGAFIDEELSSLGTVLKDLEDKREKLRGEIKTVLLKKYDIIRERRNGVAVVSVWREICEGCHMNLPPQMYNELLRSEKLMTCPHCNRIIYWKDKDADES